MLRIVIFLCTILIFSSCRKEVTSWSSAWVLPMFNDSLNLQHFTNDSTIAVENGLYILDLHRKVGSIKPSEYIEIPDTIIAQEFVLPVSNLVVPPGTSYVNNNEDHVFDLQGVELKKVRLKSGEILLKVLNPLNTTTRFEIMLPSVKGNGSSLTRILDVPPGSNTNPGINQLTINLNGYEMELTGSNGTAFNALPSSLEVSTLSSGNQVTVSSSDTTRFVIELKNLTVDYARGYFGNTIVHDTITYVSPFLNEQLMGQVDLPEMALDLTLKNSIKVTAKAIVHECTNENNETGTSVSLSHSTLNNPLYLNAATGTWNQVVPSEKVLAFHAGNSNLETFVENLGETNTIDYEVQMNPWGNLSGGWDEFFPTSSLDIYADLKMPLNLGFNGFTFVNKQAINFKQEGAVEVEEGTLTLKIKNAFPYQGKIKLYFLNEAGAVVDSIIPTEWIASSVYGSTNAIGISEMYSELDVEFTQELLQKLADIRFIQYAFVLDTPDPVTGNSIVVSIPEHAFCAVKAVASFQLKTRIGNE